MTAGEETLPCREVSPEDWKALVERPQGTQLIVGGPGTGKTEILAQRAVHSINAGITTSDAVLALSFSRATAADLRERITTRAQRSFGELSVGTFYGFARTLVEEHSTQLFASPEPPMLITTPEQIQVVREVLAKERPEEWPLFYRRMLHTRTMAEELADFMLRCGEQRITPRELATRAREKPAWSALPGFYERYLHHLDSEGKIDYTGLLLRANRALSQPEIVRNTAARFPYVLVDEYQEATLVQVEILKKLVGGGCHLSVAADPHQTSFSFRGAERASVAAFPHTFGKVNGKPVTAFKLKTGYRVPQQILFSAADLFDSDTPHLPDPAPHQGRVEFFVFDQEMAENDWIAAEINRLHMMQQTPYSEIAVLTRTARALPSLSRALDREGIPHTRPGARLIDHPAVRLVLDLAWVAAEDLSSHRSPQLSATMDAIVESMLLGPMFSLSQGQARNLVQLRRSRQACWWEVLQDELAGARSLALLLKDPSWALQSTATKGFWKLWSGVKEFSRLVESDRFTNSRFALFSFAQTLGRLAERSPNTSLLEYRRLIIEGDLEASPLLSPGGDAHDQVTISTIHQAKGRQFADVFIAGATEGIFPDTRPFRSLLDTQFLSHPGVDYSGLLEARLKEERDLAYIAMTRAHRRVVWTATAPDLEERRRTISRFLLHLADRAGSDLGRPPSRRSAPPVGPLETESHIRRIQKDICQTGPRRLAAATVLARPIRTDLWDPLGFAGMPSPGSDLGLIDPGHIMSASQAEAYQTCPRRFALEKRLLIRPPEDSPYAKFGQLIHLVLHRMGERWQQRGSNRFDLADAIEELHRQSADFDFGTPVVNHAFVERGEKLLTQLADRWNHEGGQPMGFEENVEVTLAGTPWRGRVDRIDRMADGRIRIVDYKASKNPVAVKEAKNALQLGFYLWAMAQLEPQASLAEFWFPLCSTNAWKRSFDPANLEEVVLRLEEIARAIVSEGSQPQPWPTNPSKACGKCQVRSLCPAWPEGQGAYIT
jgi:superfamily I DNA/RNA helicase/RecB family exonuclease